MPRVLMAERSQSHARGGDWSTRLNISPESSHSPQDNRLPTTHIDVNIVRYRDDRLKRVVLLLIRGYLIRIVRNDLYTMSARTMKLREYMVHAHGTAELKSLNMGRVMKMSRFNFQRLLYALATLYLVFVLGLFLSGGIEGYSIKILPFRTDPVPPAQIADTAFFTFILVAIFGSKETRLVSLIMSIASLAVFLAGTWPPGVSWQWLDIIFRLAAVFIAVVYTKRKEMTATHCRHIACWVQKDVTGYYRAYACSTRSLRALFISSNPHRVFVSNRCSTRGTRRPVKISR